jgi:hypothetical protein
MHERKQAPGTTRRALPRKALFAAFSVLLFLLVLEAALRLSLSLTYGTPYFRPSRIFNAQYLQQEPMLRDLGSGVERGRRAFRILLLGGSVLRPELGTIETHLERDLKAGGCRDFSIYNPSQLAHSSRDSYFKHRFLEDTHFDVVVVYHGINEARANNCPPEMFRSDYSHYTWYETLNVTARHMEWLDISVQPYCFDYMFHKLKQLVRPGRYVPALDPREEWVRYGANVRTAESLRQNLDGIVRGARRKGETVVLLSFAYYLPSDYGLAAFREKTLDYGRHSYPVEIWGSPANVVKALEVHNGVIRDVAESNRDTVVFLDMQDRIPNGKEYFDDICHLTDEGSETFARALANTLIEECGMRTRDD